MALGIAFRVGFITGSQGITFAHELDHSKSKIDRFHAWVLMTSVCYGHFMVEHYRGHYRGHGRRVTAVAFCWRCCSLWFAVMHPRLENGARRPW